MGKRENYAAYRYARHRDRLILRESELRATTILQLSDCLKRLEVAHRERDKGESMLVCQAEADGRIAKPDAINAPTPPFVRLHL